MSFDTERIEHRPLTSLLKFIVDNRGKTVPTSETGIPLIATNCIKDNELYPVFEKIRYISKDTYDNWFRAHPMPGDIIFVNKGTPGRVCLVPDPIDFCIAQDMMALRVDESIIDNKYLFAVLRSPQFQNQINNYHVGTLIPHFKKGDLDKLLIPIPSMQIQKNIGDYYFTLSHKIELNNRMNKVLEQMAQAIFKQWFVDFEFPNENGEPYKSSGGEMVWCEDLGKEIPVGWRQGQLGEIATYRNENITPNQIPVGTPYVGLEHIPRRKLDLDSFGDSSKLGSNKSCFKKNDILFGKLRPYFHKVSIAPFGGVCSTDIIPIYVKKEHYFGQLACTLFSDELINYVTQSSNGTKMPRTNWKDISQYEIILPDEHTSGNFTNIFRDIAEQFQVHFKESERLFNLRDTLLPKLMSGEIDVSEIEF